MGTAGFGPRGPLNPRRRLLRLQQIKGPRPPHKGVAAYKNGLYDAAIEDFQKAKELDPGLMNARLYLATAYASQYIPALPPSRTCASALPL